MCAVAVSCEGILNFPLRKLFCCELSHARFDGVLNSWTIRVDGKTFQVYLVWMQGSLSLLNCDMGNDDCAASESVSRLPGENYCAMVCEIVDVESADGHVIVKAKRIAPLNADNKMNLEVAWAVEADSRFRRFTGAHDPARARWDASGEEGTVWARSSALAIGVALEISGSVAEDAAWLRPDDARHINMAEVEAAIKGLNLALSWGLKTVELMTDSTTVHQWVSNGITGKARLRTKAAGEMLIRRRVDTIVSLVQECDLRLTVTLVKSAENKADSLTRVLSGWLRPRKVAARPICALTIEGDTKRHIEEVHHVVGEPRRAKKSLLHTTKLPGGDRVRSCHLSDVLSQSTLHRSNGDQEASLSEESGRDWQWTLSTVEDGHSSH
uniref:RNase H domain-containing protein n=1 Tax=Trichuris muris TaxID=70415 RepID=A0A5S6Q9E6_TRIMR